MGILIKDFKVGERIEGFYLIKSLNLRTSSTNKKYFDLIIGDASGSVDAKIWSIPEDEENIYMQGDIIKIRADVTLWQEKIQLKIIKYRKMREDDSIDYKSLVESSPIEAEEILNFLKDRISKIENKDIKKMSYAAIDEYYEDLIYYPAAMRNHHAIRSGLLYHIYRMVKSGDLLSNLYGLNSDLLLCGILYHDLEKISEMDSNELGIVSNYTTKGILLGHISIGVVTINDIGKRLGVDEELIVLLQHMVLSHHYEAEYGSPKKPMFAEAAMLHFIDIMDARMYDFDKAISDIEKGEFSQQIFSLDRIRVYKSKFLEDLKK